MATGDAETGDRFTEITALATARARVA